MKQIDIGSLQRERERALRTAGASLTDTCWVCKRRFTYLSNGSGRPRDTCNDPECRKADQDSHHEQQKLLGAGKAGTKAAKRLVKSTCRYCGADIYNLHKREYCCPKHRALDLDKKETKVSEAPKRILPTAAEMRSKLVEIAKMDMMPPSAQPAPVAPPSPDEVVAALFPKDVLPPAAAPAALKPEDKPAPALKAGRHTEVRVCAICGKEYLMPKGARAELTLCRDCHAKAGRKDRYPDEFPCRRCGKMFFRRGNAQVFCSKACAKAEHNEKEATVRASTRGNAPTLALPGTLKLIRTCTPDRVLEDISGLDQTKQYTFVVYEIGE